MKEKIVVQIKTYYIKLDQLLKFAGIAQTGGHAKELIYQNIVFVNHSVCTMRGKKIKNGDIIEVEDYCITIENI